MSRAALTVNTFVNPDGTTVANGTVQMRLNVDGSVIDTQIQSTFTDFLLDAFGQLIGSPTFWPNSQISPSGTYYVQKVYNSNGQLVAGPNKITVLD
jgi:hypothetical protein